MFLVLFPLIQLENIGRSIDISKAPSITLLPSSSTFMPFFSPLVVDFLGHVHGQTRMAPGRCTQHVAVISAFPRVPPTSLSWAWSILPLFRPYRSPDPYRNSQFEISPLVQWDSPSFQNIKTARGCPSPLSLSLSHLFNPHPLSPSSLSLPPLPLLPSRVEKQHYSALFSQHVQHLGKQQFKNCILLSRGRHSHCFPLFRAFALIASSQNERAGIQYRKTMKIGE